MDGIVIYNLYDFNCYCYFALVVQKSKLIFVIIGSEIGERGSFCKRSTKSFFELLVECFDK